IRQSSWLSWWAQVILSVISAITLFFANAVRGPMQGNILANGVFMAGLGLALSFINVIWTTGYQRIAAKQLETPEAAMSFRSFSRTVRVGVIVALTGMFLTLLGAEQIVGTLVAKSISGSILIANGGGIAAQTASLQLQVCSFIDPRQLGFRTECCWQALDIFVVQANTNTLLSHLSSLVNSLFIASQIPHKDE
ncbi:translocon at the inner envelope membrane of chloroplast 21 like protein, partial [Guillardia theta CCMP2712]